jgi:hypothetical protein
MNVEAVTLTTFDRAAVRIGRLGALCGLVAGTIEVVVGGSIRAWIGDKNDPGRLGLVTLTIAAVALVATSLLRASDRPERRALLVVGIALPALLGFTTVGRLWYLPGPLLLVAAALAASALRGRGRAVAGALERSATRIFASVLALAYVALGLAALGVGGVLGIAGGLAALLVLQGAARWSRVTISVLAAVSVLPFAVVTWWSVVTPLAAVLIVTFTALAAGAPPRSMRDARR